MVRKGSAVIIIVIAVVALLGLGFVMYSPKESGPTGANSFGDVSPSDQCDLTCRYTCIVDGVTPQNRFIVTFDDVSVARADCEAVSTSGDFSAAEELCTILIVERAQAGQSTCPQFVDVDGVPHTTSLSANPRDQITQAYCECDPPSVLSSPGPAATPCPQATACPSPTPISTATPAPVSTSTPVPSPTGSPSTTECTRSCVATIPECFGIVQFNTDCTSPTSLCCTKTCTGFCANSTSACSVVDFAVTNCAQVCCAA